MSVRVAVRFRPLDENEEIDENAQNLLIYPHLNCVNVARHFNLYFHDVLPLHCSQDEVFSVVQPLVDDFLRGNNVSMMTYGPSGCGKSYTMFGNVWSESCVHRLCLMPRVISYILNQLQQRFNPMDGQFLYQLQCSFMEIYNKKIRDLLDPQNKKIKFMQKENGSLKLERLMNWLKPWN